MKTYYISYGPIQRSAPTLKAARELARQVSRQTLYAIDIVANGDVVGTLTPKCGKSGRWTFRYKGQHALKGKI